MSTFCREAIRNVFTAPYTTCLARRQQVIRYLWYTIELATATTYFRLAMIRSLAFEGNQQYDDEEKPMRQIRVEIPARMNTPTRSYYPGIDQHSSNQTYRADEIYEDDYDDEILQESDPRHANLDRTPTDAAAAGNARNDYTFFKQNMSTRQSAVATRDEPPQETSHTLVSREHRPAKAELYVRVEPQQPARSEIREEVIRHRLEVLPTLVNGRLDPIPETNEPISSAGASSATMFDATDLHHDEFKRHECTSAGTSGPITTFIAVKPHTDERKSPSSAPPTKIEEGRDASSPAAPSNGLSKLDTSLVGQVHVSQGIEFNNNVAENLSGDAIVDKPPTTGVQEAKTSFVPASSTIKNAALTITDGPAERPHEQPHAEATSEEAPSPMDDKSDILSSEDSLIPSYQEQAGVTSNINIPDEVKSVSSPLDPKDILKEMDGEAAQFKSSMDIEVVPMKTETVDAQEFENRLIHDGESKLESFQGANSTVDLIKANSLAAGKPVETPLIKPVPNIDEMTSIEREPSINEKATTEVSGTSSAPISFNTDLLEPLSPPAVNSQLTEDGMLLTSMQSDDFDISSSNTQQIAETTMSDTPSQEGTIVPAAVAHSVESGAKPLDTPIPVADDVGLSLILLVICDSC
ncbi:unnamed protein product [Phytophthora lilii]|uniref:Unnamed protein product n=1 Tax=Phytophthora lilii TaxID=2077276 RepID=A0A9W6TSJ3_9STRA|nr:unnamed protein product [Phytophthora lilii]